MIRLNDGRRMVVRKNQKNLPINLLATEMLHKLSEQRAVVNGVAVIASMPELGKITKSHGGSKKGAN